MSQRRWEWLQDVLFGVFEYSTPLMIDEAPQVYCNRIRAILYQHKRLGHYRWRVRYFDGTLSIARAGVFESGKALEDEIERFAVEEEIVEELKKRVVAGEILSLGNGRFRKNPDWRAA